MKRAGECMTALGIVIGATALLAIQSGVDVRGWLSDPEAAVFSGFAVFVIVMGVAAAVVAMLSPPQLEEPAEEDDDYRSLW